MDKFADYEAGRLFVWENEILAGLASCSDRPSQDWIVRAYQQVDSTMNVARRLIPQTRDQLPILVLAQSQTAGRGRQGRSWVTGAEGLYGTYVFRVKGSAKQVHSYPLVVGLVLALCLEQFGCRPRLKWPNDILDQQGKKVGGILLELVGEEHDLVLMVGIGVNLKDEPKSVPRASSIFSSFGCLLSVPQLATSLSSQLLKSLERLIESGFQQYRSSWLQFANGLGKSMSVHVGDTILSGNFVGITEEGHLQIEIEGELREISSGEILC